MKNLDKVFVVRVDGRYEPNGRTAIYGKKDYEDYWKTPLVEKLPTIHHPSEKLDLSDYEWNSWYGPFDSLMEAKIWLFKRRLKIILYELERLRTFSKRNDLRPFEGEKVKIEKWLNDKAIEYPEYFIQVNQEIR